MFITILNWLLAISLVTALAVLAIGVGSFVKGGEFNRKYANKLMRARVATQAFAVLIILLRLWAGAGG